MQIHTFATEKYINLFTTVVNRQCGERGVEMATCPKCHTTGGNWKHCKACGMFFCMTCKQKEGFHGTNYCPLCGVANKLETREPK
jgi:hypothetical protein